MRHGDQFELAVVDAKDVIAVKVEPADIAADVLVSGRVTEAQVTVLRLQVQQVAGHTFPLGRADRADGNQ